MYALIKVVEWTLVSKSEIEASTPSLILADRSDERRSNLILENTCLSGASNAAYSYNFIYLVDYSRGIIAKVDTTVFYLFTFQVSPKRIFRISTF